MTITTTIPLLSEPVADDLDTANFPARARVNFLEVNPLMSAVNQLASELNAEATNVNAQAASAAGQAAAASISADAAATSAAAAAATSTAQNWVSGTTYAVGNVRRSLIDGLPYQRTTAGAGTTDPRDDAANWVLDYLQINTGLPPLRPSLLLDFANSGVVDSRITFARGSEASYFDAQGVLRFAAAGVPRITHDPVTGECLGLLVEGAATNSIKYSQNFENAAWFKGGGVSLAPEKVLGIDGELSASRITLITASNNTIEEVLATSLAIGVPVVISIFVKLVSGSLPSFQLGYYDGGVAVNASHVAIGGAGVFNRLVFAFTPSVSVASPRLRLIGFSIDAVAVGSVIDICAAQLETGVTRPSSYIKTEASAVTRAADLANIVGANFNKFFNPAEGTMVLSVSGDVGVAGSNVAAALVDPSNAAANYMYMVGRNNFGFSRDFTVRKDGVELAAIGTSIRPFGAHTVSVSYKSDNFLSSYDGGIVSSDTSGTIPAVGELRIGRLLDSSTFWGGHIKRIDYYPRASTAAELMALSRI